MGNSKLLFDSTLDSNRFGIKVARGYIPKNTPEDRVAHEIATCDASLIIIRTEAGDSEPIFHLQRQGYLVIHADTLVYYGINLTLLPQESLPEEVRLASLGDQDAIHEIAENSFVGYRSHYAANPLLSKKEILAGYIEWAKSRLAPDKLKKSCTWVVMFQKRVAGFASCDISEDTGQVEIVLNAIHPQFARRGLYEKLLRGILHYYASQSYQRLVTSTQIWNYTVQRRWTRAGLCLERAYDTYHIDQRLREKGGMP